MKIFLIGEIGIGKSTVINKTLDLLKVEGCGFRTYFCENRRSLFMDNLRGDKEIIAAFNSGKTPPIPRKEVIDIFGSESVYKGAEIALKGEKLMIMDELGFLESQSFEFQRAINAVLSYEIPILGVIKNKEIKWISSLMESNKEIKKIYVTKDNRDSLPYELLKLFEQYF